MPEGKENAEKHAFALKPSGKKRHRLLMLTFHWRKQKQRISSGEGSTILPCAWKEKEPERMWALMATTGKNQTVTPTKANCNSNKSCEGKEEDTKL